MDRLVLKTAVVDFRRQEVRGPAGTRIELRPRAFAVLRCLAANAERPVTKNDLLAECWPNLAVSDDSLAQCVSEIRQALGDGAHNVVRTIPRRGYLLMPPEAAISESDVVGPGDYWPAIAILPFDEFSDTPGPLGAGIAAEIITELARCQDLKVLARHASFGAAAQRMVPADITRKYGTPYVLEGTLRCEGARVVVSVQLIDGHDSRLLWAERFVVPTEAVFAHRDGLITRIASRVHSEVREAEMTTALRGVPANFDVRELTRRGVTHWRASNRPSYLRARAELERAVELDPSFALARIFLGGLNASDAAFCISGALGIDALPAAIAEIRHGIELGTALGLGHYSLGTALSLSGCNDEALMVLGRGATLRPHNADIIVAFGAVRMQAGQFELGLSDIERAIALKPRSPSYMHSFAALGLLAIGHPKIALQHATVGRERGPGFTGCFLYAAHALSALGRPTEAAAQITDLLDYSPNFTIQTPLVRFVLERNPETLERHLEYLRAAGLPEKN